MGLGYLADVSLAKAREKRDRYRKLLAMASIPSRRARDKIQATLARARSMTFQQCADAFIAANRPAWKNVKHAAHWVAPSRRTASCVRLFGRSGLDGGLVCKALEPVWTAEPETASRVCGRVEWVLD